MRTARIGQWPVRALSISLFLVAGVAFAGPRTHVFLIGGAGEPEGKTTLFDAAVEKLGKYVVKTKNPARAVFDGGHAKTEKIAGKYFEIFKGASAENAKQLISETWRAIKSGEIKKGEQILFSLVSHGTRALKAGAHGVSVGDGFFGIEELVPLIHAAEDAGIRVAIVDQSCFSGDALTFATEKTCVVSGTGPDKVGYPAEWAGLWEQAKAGVSLEKAYLAARKKKALPSSPMISTAAGRAAAVELRKLSDELLNYDWDIKIRAAAACAAGCGPVTSETVSEEVMQLESRFKSLGLTVGAAFDNAKAAWVEQRRVLAELVYLAAELKKQDAISVELAGFEPSTWATFLGFDENGYRAAILALPEQAGAAPSERQKTLARITSMVEAHGKLREQAAFKKYVQDHARYRDLSETLYERAVKIAEVERQLYDQLYAKFLNSEEADPCREFLF